MCGSAEAKKSTSLPDGFKLIDQDELSKVGYRHNSVRNARIRERKNNERYVGLGVIYSGELCYDTWVYIGLYVDPNTGIKVGKGEKMGVFLDSWAEPEFRRFGIHKAMVGARLALARRLGLNRLYVLVYSLNVGAIKAHRSYGAILVEKIRLTKVFKTTVRKKACEIESADWGLKAF